eukprot:scaffold48_cov311-Pinguiococcus_pyrenoidosus.AAC.216
MTKKSPGYECFILYGEDYHGTSDQRFFCFFWLCLFAWSFCFPSLDAKEEEGPAVPLTRFFWLLALPDLMSKTYPQPRGQLHAGGQEVTEEFVADNEESLRSGCKVLDVCCGEGNTLAYLAESFPNSQFVGIDIVQKAITTAMSGVQAMGNVSYVQGTIYDLPFEDETFDIVLGQDPDGFCHKDRIVAFEEVFRVLKLGGKLYMHQSWIPSGWSKDEMDEYDRYKKIGGSPTATVSAQDLLSDIADVGFVVDHQSDLTALAADHFKATAFVQKRVLGEADAWTTRVMGYAGAGRKFGLKVIAHRETLFELIHLEKYDTIKQVLKQKTVDEILALRDWAQFTVLHHAAKDGKLDMVRWLIEKKGLPVDVEDGNGSYPSYR